METERAIVAFGTQAVLQYRAMAQTRHDNDVPPGYLRARIAEGLHTRFGGAVQVERQYALLAMDLGLQVTADLLGVLGGQRADIALYRGGRPAGLVELKIFDETNVLPGVDTQLYRAGILAAAGQIPLLLGVMICPFGGSLEARIERLHDAVGGNLYVGERQTARDGTWQWCFACASIRS